jgi:hypothetical protein
MKISEFLQIPADTVLAEELAGEDVVEMANLTTAQTGVPGTISSRRQWAGMGRE